MKKEVSEGVLSNTLWAIIGRSGYLIIGLITNIVLARLINPELFGLISIMTFFIVIGSILIESGLSGALIIKKNITEEDYSTIFLFNLFISILVGCIIYLSAEFFANFYNNKVLEDLIKLSIFILAFNALGIIQITKLIKEMRFKIKSFCEFCSIVIGSLVSITMAWYGYDIWALVALPLFSSLSLMLLLWVIVGPLKIYKFSTKSFKEFYKFGVNTTLASLITTLFDNFYNLIIAKNFSLNSAGNYYQAKRLQDVPLGIVQSSVINVVYSYLAKINENKKEYKEKIEVIYKLFLSVNALIFSFIIVYSDTLVLILLGDNWEKVGVLLKLLSVAGFFYILEIYFRLFFKLHNKTEKILKLEIYKKIFQLITLIIVLPFMKIEYLIYGLVLTNIFGVCLSYYTIKEIELYINFNFIIDLIKVVIISSLIIIFFEWLKLNTDSFIFFSPLYVVVYLLIIMFFKLIDVDHIKALLTKYKSN